MDYSGKEIGLFDEEYRGILGQMGRRSTFNTVAAFEDLSIREAIAPDDFETARQLLRGYAKYLNDSLGAEHICLESYERELASLPGAYAAPQGVLLLGHLGSAAAGCVCLKPLAREQSGKPDRKSCEMKRLWVKPEFRGRGVGLALAEAVIAYARSRDYAAIYLDTVPGAMRVAAVLYRELGFVRVKQYGVNSILGEKTPLAVEFFRLELA